MKLLPAIVAAAGLVLPQCAAMAEDLSLETDSGPAQCTDFHREADGSWRPLRDVTIILSSGCAITIRSGRIVFRPGSIAFCGVDVASALNRQCVGGHQ